MPPFQATTITDDRIIDALHDGLVGVLPTDTVYGLVASAVQPAAVTRLYQLKHREAKPGTLIAASVEQLQALGIARRYITAVADYWPNPLSVVLPVDPELDYLSQGQRTLAVRIPADESLRQFLAQVGPLMTTSANSPGEPVATTIAEARAYFGESVAFYCDNGPRQQQVPSTVIRVVDDAIEVLRQGALQFDDNGRIL